MYCFVATSMKYKDSSNNELLLLKIIAVNTTFPLDDLKSTNSFMKAINQSVGSGGYQCQLLDSEMNKYVMKLTNDFFRAQNRQGVLQDRFSKTAACCLGHQPSSKIWVMNNHVQLDAAGKQISNEDSPYMWLGNLQNGKTIAFVEDQALVVHPDQKQTAMDTLLKVLKVTVKDNFIPAFIYLGGAAMASHYETIFQVQSMCPTPVAIGSKNTGKTTAANMAPGMLGMLHTSISETQRMSKRLSKWSERPFHPFWMTQTI